MPIETEWAQITGTGDVRRIELGRTVAATPDDAWDAITNPSRVKQWWSDIAIDAREGGRFVSFGDVANHREGGIPPLDGTVKVALKPHYFEFVWNEATEPAKGLVRFDLLEVDGGTRVTLVYFVSRPVVHIVAAGWHLLMDQLSDYLKSGTPSDLSENNETLVAHYEALLGTQ